MTSNAVENFAFGDELVRVVDRNGEPWFVARDVCRALELQGGAAQHLRNVDDDDKGVITIHTPGGEQSVTIISEGAMYGLVFKSRKPVAERFQRWVTHEVLPAIRRHGGYGHNSGASPDPAALDMARDGSFSEKLRCIELALRVHGRTRAQEMWRKMGLPEVPPAPPTERDEARKCLIHLLDFVVTDIDGERARVRELIDETLDESEAGRALLIQHGIKLHHGGEGFMVANTGEAVTRIFAGTRWRGGRHYWVLRKLAGVRPHRARFGMVTYRVTFIPLHYLDEGAPAPDLAETA